MSFKNFVDAVGKLILDSLNNSGAPVISLAGLLAEKGKTLLFAKCDGVVAEKTNVRDQQDQQKHASLPSEEGCGKNSDYTVRWRVLRE